MESLSYLFDLGLHLGHQRAFSHPKSKPFVFKVKDGFCLIDLEKTVEKLKEAKEALKKLSQEGKTILFIGTKRQAKEIIEKKAKECGMPYINQRFLGGTLTNFETMLKSLEKLEKLKEREKELEEKGYKKELKKTKTERERMENLFGGITSLKRLPDALFVVDMVKEKNAVSEANRLGIPIFAICDTNADPSLCDYPIPASDDSQKGVEYLVSEVAEAILEGKNPQARKGQGKKVKKKVKKKK